MQFGRKARRATRAAVAGAGAVAAYMLVGGAAAPPTHVGTAAVTVEAFPARLVEQVNYDEPVDRVGDLVLVAGDPVSDIDDPDVASTWAVVDRVWPDSRRDDLVQLSVIREGPYGLVGVVHAASGGGWILSLDAADLGHREIVTETIVHELAHVATLGPDEIVLGESSCDEPTHLRVDLGCARRGSVLARFSERFWPGGEPADDSASSFVNDYAASAAHEDLAETFTAWVFEWPVLSSSTAADKIAFLGLDPGLVQLRVDLVERLGRNVPQPAAASSAAPSSASTSASSSESASAISPGVSPPSNSTPVSR